MAADVCSEIPSLSASPRISFSYDLNQTHNAPKEDYHNTSDASLLDPNFHFHFDFFPNEPFAQEISSADELFCNGKILPIDIKKQIQTRKGIPIQESEPTSHHKKGQPKPNPSTLSPTNAINANNETKKKRLKEYLCSSFESEEEKPFSRIFRQLKRSTSLNLESGRAKSLIRPLQFLSRSKSTGSALNPTKNVICNNTQKQTSFKQSPISLSRSTSSSSVYYPYNSLKRPPLKKSCRGYGNGGVRINPVLHISHNCVLFGSGSLFGFRLFFCNAKAKKKKK